MNLPYFVNIARMIARASHAALQITDNYKNHGVKAHPQPINIFLWFHV